MSVHPAIVIHCDIVNIASTILSNVFIPPLGPSQYFRHTSPSETLHARPMNIPFWLLSQGWILSSHETISPKKKKHKYIRSDVDISTTLGLSKKLNMSIKSKAEYLIVT